jgi:hypothetical protein
MNAWVINNKHASTMVIFEKIKKEAKLWVTVGAKRFIDLMSRECVPYYLFVSCKTPPLARVGVYSVGWK